MTLAKPTLLDNRILDAIYLNIMILLILNVRAKKAFSPS